VKRGGKVHDDTSSYREKMENLWKARPPWVFIRIDIVNLLSGYSKPGTLLCVRLIDNGSVCVLKYLELGGVGGFSPALAHCP
jgi:hypothetical protein